MSVTFSSLLNSIAKGPNSDFVIILDDNEERHVHLRIGVEILVSCYRCPLGCKVSQSLCSLYLKVERINCTFHHQKMEFD
jgi:hypothetical protein